MPIVLIQLCCIPQSTAAAEEDSHILDIDAALTAAFRNSPALRARRAERDRSRAELARAETYPLNPTLKLAAGRRSGLAESTTDRSIELSQEVEVRAQGTKRKKLAEASLEAAEGRFERERRLLAARVRLAFAEAIRSRDLLNIAMVDAELSENLLRFEERRLEGGASTEIDLNLARSATGRTVRALRLAEASAMTARHFLAELLGLDPATPPAVQGEIPRPEEPAPNLSTLLASARENRADLVALRRESEAAERAIDLEKTRAFPRLGFDAYYKEEEGTDEILGLRVALPLPLFNRSRGDVQLREAERDRSLAQTDAALLTIEREVADALSAYRAAVSTERSLQELVVGNLETNLDLIQRSFEAGRINAVEVLVFRRELVDGQRQFIQARADAWSARIFLDLATGRTTYPTEDEVSR